MNNKEERQEPWKSAYAIIRKKDGTMVNGTVLGQIKTKVGSYLVLLLDWGSTLVDESKIVEIRYS